MSGEYGKIFKRVWGDPDFKALNAEEQLLYIKLFSQSDVSMAGVLTLATTRWATQTSGLTTSDIDKSLRTLQERGYIAIDTKTQEVLLRSYIRNDGGWVSVKTIKGVANAVRRVLSPYLRGVIAMELGRLDMNLVKNTQLKSGAFPLDIIQSEIGYLRDENPPQEPLSHGVSDGVSHGVSDGVSRSCPPTATATPTATTTPTATLSSSEPQAAPDVKKENARNNDPDIQSLCTYLADWIESNGSKRPTITQRWRDECRLMIDKDGRTPDQIRAAIDWSQQDGFWKANILSMPTLRAKYDQLRLRAQAENHQRTPKLTRSEEIYLAEKRRIQTAMQQQGERQELTA